jgi:hypothetical protein
MGEYGTQNKDKNASRVYQRGIVGIFRQPFGCVLSHLQDGGGGSESRMSVPARLRKSEGVGEIVCVGEDCGVCMWSGGKIFLWCVYMAGRNKEKEEEKKEENMEEQKEVKQKRTRRKARIRRRRRKDRPYPEVRVEECIEVESLL